MRTTLTLLLSIFCCCIHAQYCGILYVDANAAGANTGTSWADAYTDLQDAIDAASPGGQLWVAAGSYLPAKDQLGNPAPIFGRDKTFFINKDIQLYGGFAGTEQQLSERDAAANPTILSGDLGAVGVAADNAYRVLWLSAVSPACVLDGFTIAHGNGSQGGGAFLQQQPGQHAAPTIRNCIFENNNAASGGGLHIQSTEWAGPPVRIENCIFRNNTASSGAGIYLAQGVAAVISLEMASLEFAGNNCSGHGGGLYAQGFFRASNCRFESNEANRGAGANIEGGNAGFENCSFISNTSLRNGGGLRMEGAAARLVNCHFTGNEANILSEPFTTTDAGGGLFYRGSSSAYARLVNCVFSGNKGDNGAAFAQASSFLSTASSELDNCSFAGNNGLSAVARLGGSLTLDNSIVYGNAGTPLTGGTARNCIIEGGYAGTGNLNANPQFADLPIFNLAPTAAGNLRLQPNSPAIGQGDNSLAPLEATTDAGGNRRIVNCQLDIGAFESGDPAPSDIVCYADADGDGLGDPSAPRLSCSTCPAGFVLNGNDCDGGNAAVTTGLPAPAAIQPAAEFCRGEPDAALRTVSAEALGQYSWVLVQAPAGSSFAGMVPLSFSPGQVNTEFSIGLDRVVMCDSPANQSEPVYGTWVFEAYYETAGGCQSAVAQGFTATANEGGAQGLIAASESRLCPGEAAVLFFEATAGEGPFAIVVNGQTYTGLEDGSPFDTLVAGVDFADSLRLQLSQVSDDSACETGGGAVQDIVLISSAGISAVEVVQENVSCSGEGAVVAIVQGGQPPFQYLWDDGQAMAEATGLSEGLHFITITDSDGCEIVGSVNVAEQESLTMGIQTLEGIACTGGAGTARADAGGGVPPYTFLWSNGQSAATATGLPAGWHQLTLTDGNGCTAVDSIFLSEPEILETQASEVQSASCAAATDGIAMAQASGGTPPYQYLWDDGQTTGSAGGLAAGPHAVTITDANGCTVAAAVEISAPPALELELAAVSPLCTGQGGQASAAASGGAPPYAFLWSDGQSGPAAIALEAGVYSVTATDANGCTITEAITVTEPPALELEVVSVLPAGCSEPEGQATVQATGGNGVYAYQWSGGQSGTHAVGLAPGAYSVTVADGNGCQATASFSIAGAEPLALEEPSLQHPACSNSADGQIELGVSGGLPPYSYSWANGQEGPIAAGLSAGLHIVTITDAAGCVLLDSFTLQASYQLLIGINMLGSVRCRGDSTAALRAVPVGGLPPFAFLWSTGQATAEISGLPAGSYAVTITDANGCSASGGALAQDPPFLEVQLDVMPPSCANSGDGRIIAEGSGGTPPYAYHWSDGQAGQSFVVETAGTFTVTLTDANQCTAVSGLSVELPAGLEGAVASIGPATCQEADDGSATVEAFGGTPPYSFLWGDGQSGAEAFGLAPGDYLVSVTDANGCQVELGLTVPAGAYEPDLGISQEGEALAVAEAGAEYQWIDCQTGEELSGAHEQLFIPAVSGAYAVVVTDSPSGCRATSECVEVMVVATEDAGRPAQQATAFPNPNDGRFTLVLPWAAEAWLYDASGRLLRRESYGPGSHPVEMGGLPAGMYVLALKGMEATQVLRLIRN